MAREPSDTAQLKLRLREPLRQKIEASAETNGVTMNAEIVARLEKSFEIDQRIEDVFGSPQVFGIMKIISSVMNEMGKSEFYRWNKLLDHGILWMNDPVAYGAAVNAAKEVLDTLRPPGEIPEWKTVLKSGKVVGSTKTWGSGKAREHLAIMAEKKLHESDAISAEIRKKLEVPAPKERKK